MRPSWLAFIAVVVGFVVACYTLLAPWQFGREAQRDVQQRAIDTSYALPPVSLTDLVPASAAVGRDVEWRQVQVSGTYLSDAETLVRLRVIDGKPAYEVLTPLRTTQGGLVTIDRGWVSSGGQAVPDYPAPPTGQVSVTGRLRVNETDPQGRAVFTSQGHRQVYAADSRPVAAATGLDLPPGYVQLSADQPGVLGVLAVAPSTGGAPFSNLSYALQWLTFGAIALVAMGYFIRLELLQRRDRRSTAGLREAPLADRYGRR